MAGGHDPEAPRVSSQHASSPSETANATGSAILMSPRTWQTLSKVKEVTGSAKPVLVAGSASPTGRIERSIYGMPVYLSSQMSITETQGTNSDCSSAYVVQADQLVVVLRSLQQSAGGSSGNTSPDSRTSPASNSTARGCSTPTNPNSAQWSAPTWSSPIPTPWSASSVSAIARDIVRNALPELVAAVNAPKVQRIEHDDAGRIETITKTAAWRLTAWRTPMTRSLLVAGCTMA